MKLILILIELFRKENRSAFESNITKVKMIRAVVYYFLGVSGYIILSEKFCIEVHLLP